jgi:N-acetylmuramoyl-L-alanine amidase
MTLGRAFFAIAIACVIILFSAPYARPSYDAEAQHVYAIASQRLADFRKLPRKRQYRSYWIDCIRTFELVENNFPKSPQAKDACFDRARLYRELYQQSGRAADQQASLRAYKQCEAAYPEHAKATEARMRPGQAAQGALVRNIRYWSGGDYTRVVLDYDHQVNYQVLELKDPDRLVFDLQHARLAPSVDSGPLPVNDGILRRVRSSQYAPGIVRVVLDLASIKGYAVFPLRDPGRLVIDVTGAAGPGAPQEANGPKAISGPPTPNNAGISLSRQLGLKVRTIAIDAGHGGRDPGAIGKGGTKEKDVTLDIAKRLAALVKKGIGCNVVMTRDRDVFVPLEERPAIARTKGADLFVSIHVNASRRRRTRGIETYIQGLRASDRDAMATAARENSSTGRTLSELDDELAKILTGLRMESNDEDSIHLAHAVQDTLVSAAGPLTGREGDLGVKRAFFYVLINTGMPSILAEVGFISNPTEERLLRKESFRQALAEALYEGVKKYVDARASQSRET